MSQSEIMSYLDMFKAIPEMIRWLADKPKTSKQLKATKIEEGLGVYKRYPQSCIILFIIFYYFTLLGLGLAYSFPYDV